VEGNSFSGFGNPDLMVMVARPDQSEIKRSARRVLETWSTVYLSNDPTQAGQTRFAKWLYSAAVIDNSKQLSLITSKNILARIQLLVDRERALAVP
jgi:hypothetical protein